MISETGDAFGLQLLIQEDILNTVLSPQYEDYDDYLFHALMDVIVDNYYTIIEEIKDLMDHL